MNKKYEFKVGDKVRIREWDAVEVTNAGSCYSNFDRWKGLEGYKQNFVNNSIIKKGKLYKVLNIHEHGGIYKEERILALVQDTSTTQVFIINIDGIKKA